MNIIILNGSPRKLGNTSAIVDQLKSGMEENKHNIETIHTTKLNIKPCIACDYCRTHNNQCVHKDDTNETITKVLNSDIVVFATPVYWWGVSAQLKLVIDKFYSAESTLRNKMYGLFTVGASDVNDIQYELISSQFKSIANYLSWTNIFDESEVAERINELRGDMDILLKYKEIGAQIK